VANIGKRGKIKIMKHWGILIIGIIIFFYSFWNFRSLKKCNNNNLSEETKKSLMIFLLFNPAARLYQKELQEHLLCCQKIDELAQWEIDNRIFLAFIIFLFIIEIILIMDIV
jgi:hypothetical protein